MGNHTNDGLFICGIQGGSNMTGTICVQTSWLQSRSYLNHLVSACIYYIIIVIDIHIEINNINF